MNQAVEELVEIIANAGVLGSCSALCNQLDNSLEATVCNLLCDYVGINEFVNLLDDVDPDPVFYCQELDVCATSMSSKAKITKVVVKPPSGPAGTTFNFMVQYQVINTTGTATLEIDVFPPDSDGGFPFGDAELLGQVTPATYTMQFQMTASPSENEDFSPGKYKTQIALCEGTCGSIHSYAYTLDVFTTSFNITA